MGLPIEVNTKQTILKTKHNMNLKIMYTSEPKHNTGIHGLIEHNRFSYLYMSDESLKIPK
ncbi:hypothetical protein Hanom_Chr09g00819351 [Helianthus anomalus]